MWHAFGHFHWFASCQIDSISHSRLQELASDDRREAGRIPRSTDCELTADLVDACVPGDVVTITAVVKATGSQDNGEFHCQCRLTQPTEVTMPTPPISSAKEFQGQVSLYCVSSCCICGQFEGFGRQYGWGAGILYQGAGDLLLCDIYCSI